MEEEQPHNCHPDFVVLVVVIICALANVAFVFVSASGAFGPASPSGFLKLIVAEAVACLIVWVLWAFGRVHWSTAFATTLLLAGMASLNYWAAWESAAAC